MTISREIREKILAFSQEEKHQELSKYLKEKLQVEELTPSEILDFARKRRFKRKTKEIYIIDSGVINRLGVAVSKREDEEGRALSVEFFKLASDRGSSWGSRNYAERLLREKDQASEALIYAKKAVELHSEKDPSEHKLVLCRALRANQEYWEANIALKQYITFKCSKDKESIEPAIKLFSMILAEFEDDINEKESEPAEEQYLENIKELAPLIAINVEHKEISALREKAAFLQGQYYEKLKDAPNAWGAYCLITDKSLSFYPEAVAARARLLKIQIRIQITSSKDESEKKMPSTLLLPQEIPLSMRFGESWRAEASWFDSVAKDAMASHFEDRIGQLDKITDGKEEEISLMEEALKIKKTSNELKEKKKAFEKDLERLQETQKQIELSYKRYSSISKRRVFRRHAAERRFFQPSRSTKASELIALTEELIAQRFRTSDEEPEPIHLEGKSARLLITSERLFQEAILTLNNESTKPFSLGIPTAREKPWSLISSYSGRVSGTNNFGPKEYYQTGETIIESEHRENPKPQRLGNSFLPQHSTYNVFYNFLSGLTDDQAEKEKALARYMIRYGKNHIPLTLKELEEIYDKANIDDVNRFNQFCFLILEKEQAQWHSATNESLTLGMSVAQARCLILIEAGALNFREVFRNTVCFGVYSHKDILQSPKSVAETCAYIEELYMKYLQGKKSEDYYPFFKKTLTGKGEERDVILTRGQAHADMLQVYGGESDTDDEGYETDLSMSSPD
jgi:hypothetical protein